MALPILNEEKVRNLAHVIRYQEANAINVLNFSTEAERSKYLKDSKWNYDTVVALLDSAAQLKAKLQGDGVWGPLADDFHAYMVYSANAALQTVSNYSLRMAFLEKLSAQADDIVGSLNEQDPAKVAELAEQLLNLKTIMLQYLNNYRSTASRNFSLWIKNSRITFPQLVQRYQREAGYQGQFKDLEDEQKIMVYERIIQASGRGSVHMVNGKFIEESGPEGWTLETTKLMSGENQELMRDAAASIKKMGAGSIVGLLWTAGNMTWDIYTAENKIKVATRDAVTEVASTVGGALVTAVVTTAIDVELAVEADIIVSAIFTMIGEVTGFVGGFIIGAFAGFLFDLFFSSGGGPLSTEGLKCYVANLPDGVTLAWQIAHQP